MRVAVAGAGDLVDRRAQLAAERVVPAARGVVVVRPGVDDLVLAVVGEPVRAVRVGVERVLHDRHPRVAEAVAQPLDGRGDDAEVLGDQRQLPELRGRGVEHRAARPALPAARQRVPRSGRHRPVGDEAAEVVDAGEVVELERAPQPLDPPAVAAALQRRPVVERVAPQLALVGERVGRRARHGAVLEELGMGAVVGAAGRDVDGDVADQLHAAIYGVLTQRGPLAVEADLVGDRPAGVLPVVDPVGVALAEVQLLLARDLRPRIGQEPRPRGECGLRLVRRPVAVRRAEGEHLPPRLAGVGQPVDERVRLRPERCSGK